MTRIWFITVQYNNPRDTEIFVRSFDDLADKADCRIIIVDNSTAGQDRTSAAEFERVASVPLKVLFPPDNLYYWGAAKFALETEAPSPAEMPDWVVICNNDVTLDDPLFLRKLRALDRSKFPIVAPRILATSGEDQNPLLEVPPGPLTRLKWRIYDANYRAARTLLAIHRTYLTIATQRGRPAPAETVSRIVYAPHGACLILSSEFFRRGGELDTAVPMFAEELTIAAMATRLSLPVWYHPNLHVSHREHSTTGRELTRPKYEMERVARRRYYQLLEGS